MLPVLDEVVAGLSIHADRLNDGMTADLFATYDAFREVKAGLPFRDAYRKTAERVEKGSLQLDVLKSDLALVIEQARTELDEGETKLTSLTKAIREARATLNERQKSVLRRPT